MPNYRILPALGLLLSIPLAVLAQAPAPSAPAAAPVPSADAAAPPKADAPKKIEAPPTEAELALDDAIKKVRELKSVSAEVAQTVDMLGQRFTVQGRYLKAPGHRVRLELRVFGLGDKAGEMVQACDGNTLYDYQQVLDASRCQVLRIDQILKKLEAPEFTPDFRTQVISGMGFSGPESLLNGLRKAIKFDRKEANTLEVQVGKDKTETREVWILRGDWQDRESLTDPRKGQALPATGPLPPYIPSQAVLWVGREDGWPYKIQLEGRARSILSQPRQAAPDGRTPAARPGNASSQDRPSRMVLVYGNVKLNPDLGPADFAFQPPDPSTVVDQTKDALDGLEQRKTAFESEARRKADAEATKPEPGKTELEKEKGDPLPEINAPKLQP